MQQLEHALELLADRAEPVPLDVLVWRLEMQLAAEGASLNLTTGAETTNASQARSLDGFRPRRRRWQGPFLAAGVAAAVFVLIGGVAWLLGHGGSEVVEEPMPTTTTTPASVPDAVIPVAVNALPSSSTRSPIDETSGVSVADGSLWAATEGGMVRWDLDDRSAEVFTPDNGLPISEGGMGQVAVAPDGAVWAYSWSQDVVMFDGARWTEPRGYDQVDIVNPRCVPDEDCRNPITAMAIGPDNLVSLAVGPDTLLQFDGTAWNVVPITPAETHGDGAYAWATDIAVAPDGTLWIASWEELLRFDGATWDRFTVADGLPSGAISTVVVAPNGDVWIGTTDGSEVGSGGGVARFDGESWAAFDASDGLYSSSVTALDVAPDGTVWAVHGAADAPATSTERANGGISRFDGGIWSPTAISDVGVGFGWGGAAVDDSGTLWVSSRWGVIGFDGAEAVGLRVDETARPAIEVPHTVGEGGTDILATTVAGPVEPAAICPVESQPDDPGATGQARPPKGSGPWLGAAMDTESGRIVAVADASGGTETWTFDVCTNTWTEMQPTGWVPSAGIRTLVYDADSDVVVAFGLSVAAYDVDTDTWTRRGDAPDSDDDWPRRDALYDPVSGLIVVRLLETSEMWAYDVDSDTWTQIRQGAMVPPGDPAIFTSAGPNFWTQHFAYDEAADRIVLYLSDNSYGFGIWDGAGTEMTWTYDLREGDWAVEDTTTPELSPAFSFGSMVYDNVTGQPVVAGNDVVVGYETALHQWEVLWESPSEPDALGSGEGVHYRQGSAVVYDSINHRTVVIGGDARMLAKPPYWVPMDDVWAFDTATGTWADLLASSNP